MFKVIALIGAVAGGATYGIYEYAHDGGWDRGTCPLSGKSCCSGTAQPVDPDCSAGHDACCSEKAAAPKAFCCGDAAACPTSAVSATLTKKAAPCCANPCPACAAGCDGCPICETDCSACCGLSANAAVAGPAAAFVAKPKK